MKLRFISRYISNSGANNKAEDLMNAPERITVGGVEYDKGMVLIREALPDRIPHFTSLHRRGKFWIQYDGIQPERQPEASQKRFRRVVPQDYAREHKRATELLYWKSLPKVKYFQN